ncbi:MAG: Ig-like domain-containing protein, partial [Lachnospiraceae bacterium]|nr:Ig-like domain-containing protein [Lachnospiraceae bacterium]
MGDCARQRKRNGSVRGIPHTGRRQRLRRLFSLFLIALMVLVQPLEALGAGTTYKVDLLDTILTDPTQPSGKKLYEQQTIEAGGKVTRPKDPDAIVDQATGTKYLFFGWFTDSCTTIGSYPLESWAYDFDKEVTNNFPLYAWYLIERTAANTKSVYDGWSEEVTINKSVNKTQWFMFTPDTTGEYTISGPGNKRTNYKINWYGTDYMIYSPIYSELGPYTVNLEAGKTYYWNINLQNSNGDTNSYAFTLKKEGGVEKKEIKSLTKSSISNQTYTGSEIIPPVTIKDGTTTLQEGKDYTLTYSNNINVSTSSSKAKVVIEAVAGSDYTGSYTIEFWIIKADAPSNKPATTMSAAYNVKTVGEVPLPEGWSWQSGYTNTALKSGQAVSAVAEYTGADKGNYKTTTVTINITRAAAAITGFTLNADKKELKVNQEFTLEVASVTPSDADYSVNWNSSDSKVAVVDSNGKVTAKASGTATITAQIGNISRTCTITVTNKVEDFSLNKTTLSLKGNGMEKLSVTTTPVNPDSYTIQWSSDNPEVAAVDKDGNVTAKASGTAIITASIGSISKTCTITVTNQVEDFTLNQTKLSLKGKETAELSVASTTPENPDTYTVQWSSSNTLVADVDGDGKETSKARG